MKKSIIVSLIGIFLPFFASAASVINLTPTYARSFGEIQFYLGCPNGAPDNIFFFDGEGNEISWAYAPPYCGNTQSLSSVFGEQGVGRWYLVASSYNCYYQNYRYCLTSTQLYQPGTFASASFLIFPRNATNMTQTISQGSKSVSADASANFSALAVSTSTQTATTSFAINPSNLVGDGASYSVTMAVTNLTTIGGVQTVAGSNDTLTAGGTYDGTYGVATSVVRYDVKIVTGGALGAAEYQWRYSSSTDSDWSDEATTGTGLALEKGVTVTFGSVTYVIDDEWQFGVDVLPYTDLTVAPGSPSANSGDTTGMTAGSSGAFSGTGVTSTAKALLTTEYYRGMGDFAQSESLSQSVHMNPIAGSYGATATITIL
jgi:hypothetical protein